MNKPTKDNTAAVIVSFNPEEEILANIRAINKQVKKVIIIDNGSSQRRNLVNRAAEIENVIIKYNDKNRGLAEALNQGVEEAVSRGFEWVITLDQDSIVAENLIYEYHHIISSLPEKSSIGLIGVNFCNKTTGAVKYRCPQNNLWKQVDFLITSGTLMPVNVWQEVGPFRNEFFIDRIDYEYCLRCRQHGLAIVTSCEVLMDQNVGNKTEMNFLGKSILRSTHSDKRRYYIVRNQLILSQEYFLDEPKWVVKKILFLFLSVFYKKAPDSSWYSWMKYNFRGFYDGIMKRTGKLLDE